MTLKFQFFLHSEEELSRLCSLFGKHFLGVLEIDEKLEHLGDEWEIHQRYEIPYPKNVTLYGEFENEENAEKILSLCTYELKSVEIEKPRDYVSEYYASTGPTTVGTQFIIVPSWIKEWDKSKLPLFMDPSAAFGTGEHATTSMCVENIEQVLRSFSIKKALDVGTGSGILALVMAKLGVEKIDATEIDDLALEVAERNFRSHRIKIGLHNIGTSAALEKKFPARNFDLIVSNILLNANLDYFIAFSSLIRPGGFLIISGILSAQMPTLLENYKKSFEIWCLSSRNKQNDSWTNCILRRING